MTAPHQRSRRLVAIPLGMAMATALAVVPNVAASAAGTTEQAAARATPLSHVVHVRPGHGPSARVKKAITEAGGTIVTSYDRIGVIVVQS